LEDEVVELKKENDKLLRMIMTKFSKEEIDNMKKHIADPSSPANYLQRLRDRSQV